MLASDVPALRTALAAALTGHGPAVVPLPQPGGDRDRVLTMAAVDEPLEVNAAALVATSGSTGTPKGVLLSAEAIVAGAQATHQVVGGPGAWHLAVPGHYVAGLMVIARAVVADTEVVKTPTDLSALSPVAGQRNYLSVVPTQLRRVQADAQIVAALRRFDAVLLGGAPATPDELVWWRAAGVPIVTTYGMSETSGGCVYDGRPLPGVQIELDETGRVSISGEVVFSGYRGRRDLTEESLVLTNGTRTLRTRDRGRWDGDRLQILGRIDDVVISGGVNVDLAEVERVAQRVLDDASLAAVGIPDAEWGTKVTLAGPHVPALPLVRDALEGALSRAALPREVVQIELPLTSGGKIDRREIIRRWAEMSRAGEMPRNDVR